MPTPTPTPADLDYPNLHGALASFGIRSKRNPNREGRILYRNGAVIGAYDVVAGWALVAELEAEAA